jgi:hypothetical protein
MLVHTQSSARTDACAAYRYRFQCTHVKPATSGYCRPTSVAASDGRRHRLDGSALVAIGGCFRGLLQSAIVFITSHGLRQHASPMPTCQLAVALTTVSTLGALGQCGFTHTWQNACHCQPGSTTQGAQCTAADFKTADLARGRPWHPQHLASHLHQARTKPSSGGTVTHDLCSNAIIMPLLHA